jgi:hypothetical protein
LKQNKKKIFSLLSQTFLLNPAYANFPRTTPSEHLGVGSELSEAKSDQIGKIVLNNFKTTYYSYLVCQFKTVFGNIKRN